jgi:SAM-dependent methyltransferase
VVGEAVAVSWRSHEDEPTERPEPPGPEEAAFYREIGDFQGELYRRNAFARHTRPEVHALGERLGLRAGDRVLDVGCGDGRHLRALASRGISGVGVDISTGLLAAGIAGDTTATARFVCADARRLPVRAGLFDAAWSLSQGGLGTHPDSDPIIVEELARSLRTGGRAALTFFHALFAARHLAPGDAFDPRRLVHHQESEVVGPDDERRRFNLWTSAYTAREAGSLVEQAGLTVLEIAGCEPGRYGGRRLGLDDPEILVIAEL